MHNQSKQLYFTVNQLYYTNTIQLYYTTIQILFSQLLLLLRSQRIRDDWILGGSEGVSVGRCGDVMRGSGGGGAGESDHVRGVLLTLRLLLRDESYQVSSKLNLLFIHPYNHDAILTMYIRVIIIYM